MSDGRYWRELIDSWWQPAWSGQLYERVLVAEKIVKRLEPLGIMLAVIGLAVSIISFQIDYADRTVERKLRAWEIITSEGPIHGGKREALEFLINNGKDLSTAKLSEVDLWKRNLAGFDLRDADLREAELGGADLRGASLREADLRARF